MWSPVARTHPRTSNQSLMPHKARLDKMQLFRQYSCVQYLLFLCVAVPGGHLIHKYQGTKSVEKQISKANSIPRLLPRNILTFMNLYTHRQHSHPFDVDQSTVRVREQGLLYVRATSKVYRSKWENAELALTYEDNTFLRSFIFGSWCNVDLHSLAIAGPRVRQPFEGTGFVGVDFLGTRSPVGMIGARANLDVHQKGKGFMEQFSTEGRRKSLFPGTLNPRLWTVCDDVVDKDRCVAVRGSDRAMLTIQQDHMIVVDTGRSDAVWAVTFHSDGMHFLSGNGDGVRQWRVGDGEEVARQTGMNLNVVSVSRDHKWIVCGVQRGASVWDAGMQEKVVEVERRQVVAAVDISPLDPVCDGDRPSRRLEHPNRAEISWPARI
ncbi:hypothetical protein HD554DRAFT_2039394 [Boletus coccyginus]|nr:hypothetical protein HD554DRAFT_2039394 [Boletus coccyginus]